jgi:small ligand-binding sensory domain FIST
MRSHIITSQIAPALVLIGVFVLAVFDKFSTAPDPAKFLVIGVAAVTGMLATISQYAAVREGEALIYDLRKVANPSALATKISGSRELLSLTAITIVLFDIAMIALVVWAVLGA